MGEVVNLSGHCRVNEGQGVSGHHGTYCDNLYCLISCSRQISSAYKSLETLSDEEKLAKLSTLKLRYFTPREIANLHGFPATFGFPEEVTTRQRYRLLGNSLNVHIVAQLIALMLQSP
ncbi:hypothetical protein GDO81_012531 [Engystomops pustulosus]|uniref:Uncharacterized protein n=1 Tax=Engystomops pustulosus TaxID=76066 RepID=A0AAV7BM94_ENGPU|nr:hypothetical protein GDO81_012531 [Engystomops pustulosus]